MLRNQFIKSLLALGAMSTLKDLHAYTDQLPVQSKRMPVLFTSHGNPMDIVASRDERPFWKTLYDLGRKLEADFDVKAALVISAHWCTRGTFVNVSHDQKQIYDYYGFPKEYYDVKYSAHGVPELAREVSQLAPGISPTDDWGLDHGAWPMLMHLFPEGNVPVFQLSIDYYAKPQYHFDLGKELSALRDKGVLIIGSGALVHNLPLAGQKFRTNDMSPYGWELEYDAWIKQQIDQRNFADIINYSTSHKLGPLAAPTPDHFVPVLYSLGLLRNDESLRYFYEPQSVSLPAFSERSFIVGE